MRASGWIKREREGGKDEELEDFGREREEGGGG